MLEILAQKVPLTHKDIDMEHIEVSCNVFRSHHRTSLQCFYDGSHDSFDWSERLNSPCEDIEEGLAESDSPQFDENSSVQHSGWRTLFCHFDIGIGKDQNFLQCSY